MGRYAFVGVAISIAFAAFGFRFFTRPHHHQHHNQSLRLFNAQELALYNGTDERLPIFLGIMGSVFDVTKGKSHYGVGGGYNHFAGRDASRAFVSGNFTGVPLVGWGKREVGLLRRIVLDTDYDSCSCWTVSAALYPLMEIVNC